MWIYALIFNRKDRKELETKMMEKKRIEEIEFHYYCKDVKVYYDPLFKIWTSSYKKMIKNGKKKRL